MQFFRNLFTKNTYSVLNHSKELVIAVTFVVLPLFYPNTAVAGIFSFMSEVAGDKVDAKVSENEDAPNSQNMHVLRAVVNTDPAPISPNDHQILASANALVAEIGPAGTASDIDEPENTDISLYVVRPGDTLSEIAQMFDVSVNTILWANDMTRNSALKTGQTLVILPITGIRHTVIKGETIKGIVQKYKANLEEVLQYNDITLNSTLAVGSTIIIPDAEPTVSVKTSVSTKSGTGTSYAKYYLRPIKGGRKSQGIHGHNGVDLAAPVGTPIYASAAGTVIASKNDGGWNGGYGNYLIISHANGTQTLYSHNLKNLVSVGDRVEKGDTIARIGMTGKTTGPHLHFEIRGNGVVNPF